MSRPNMKERPEQVFDRMVRGSHGEFKNHVLTKEEGAVWLCHNPQTRHFYFRVLFVPYHVVIVGDLGSQVLACSDFNSLAWLRGSINSRDYVLGKAEHKEYLFYVVEALEYIDELLAEYVADAAEEEQDEVRDPDEPIEASYPEKLKELRESHFDLLALCFPPRGNEIGRHLRPMQLAEGEVPSLSIRGGGRPQRNKNTSPRVRTAGNQAFLSNRRLWGWGCTHGSSFTVSTGVLSSLRILVVGA